GVVLYRAHRPLRSHGVRRIHLGRYLSGHWHTHMVVFHLGTSPGCGDYLAPRRHVASPAARPAMIAALLFSSFVIFMAIGVPVAIALGISGSLAILLSNLDTHWFGLMAVPQSFYAGLAKYPLLAIPMFVLVGSIFDRSGVAARLVNFAIAIVGRGPGMLPLVTIAVAMFLGGISGSGPACAAAVGAVMIGAMKRAG